MPMTNTTLRLLLALCSIAAAAPPDLVLDDAYSLRRGGVDALLRDLHSRTTDRSTPRVGAWPAPVLAQQIAPSDTQAFLQYRDTVQHREPVQQRMALLHPLLGLTYRQGLTGPTNTSRGQTDLEAWVVEGGGVVRAQVGELHAWGDARISVERQSPFPHSYDGQFIEPAEEGDNSIATFTSFARFEGRMTLDTRLGRFGAGRHRQHWGPAYHYPLVLGQWSQPYSHVDWSMDWGPFRMRTLWAQLSIDGGGQFRSDTASRSLYAHRYEWSPTRWLDLGISEALILYKTQEPIAFVPIVPLFMMKGQSVERYANGSLSFDGQVRPLDGWRLFAEFLIDDISEPASLFNDFWKNKWALTVGSHVAWDPAPEWTTGLVSEVSRVEPWVYTQYVPLTNQATHQGLLLGSQNGPNTLSVAHTAYATFRGASVSAGLEWVRMGTDSGSNVTDTRDESSRAAKEFLSHSEDALLLKTRLSHSLWNRADFWVDASWSLLEEQPVSVRRMARLQVGVLGGL